MGLPCVFVCEEMLLAWVLKVSVRKLRFRLRLLSLMFSVTYVFSLNRKIEEHKRLRDV